MKAPDLEVCRMISVRSGLPLQFVIKEFHVFGVLGQIAALGDEKLVFKGGTALNKIYLGGLQRFSEDLDFDIDVPDRRALLDYAKSLSGKIEGYDIADLRWVRDTAQFYCAYATPLGGKDHVRVDIARKKIMTSKPVSRGVARSEWAGLMAAGIPVYSLEDLTARKLNALANRAEGKDFYDAYGALPLCHSLREALGPMLRSEGSDMRSAAFLQHCLQSVQKADPIRLRNLTNPFIPLPKRPTDWSILKNELAERLEKLQKS